MPFRASHLFEFDGCGSGLSEACANIGSTHATAIVSDKENTLFAERKQRQTLDLIFACFCVGWICANAMKL
jgi:hypothetical protein